MKRNLIMLLAGLAFTFCGFAAAFGSDGNIDIHGFISQGYIQSDHNNFLANTGDGTFQFNEIGINFSTGIAEKLRIGIQFFARDSGDVGNDEVTVDWAYADYLFKNWLGIRAGKLKIPIGLYNKVRDMDMLRTEVILPQSVYYDNLRDTQIGMEGVGLYGTIRAGLAGTFGYQVLGGSMNIDPQGGTAKAGEGFQIIEGTTKIDVDDVLASGIEWYTPLDGLVLAGTFFDTSFISHGSMSRNLADEFGVPPVPMTLDYNKYRLNVISTEYTWNSLVIAGEHVWYTLEALVNVPAYGVQVENDLKMEGFYVKAGYRLIDWFEFAVNYSEFYPNVDDKTGRVAERAGEAPFFEGFQKDWTLSTRFDINENWIFKLEGHMIDGVGMLLIQDNPGTGIGGKDYKRYWYLGAAKLTFSF